MSPVVEFIVIPLGNVVNEYVGLGFASVSTSYVYNCPTVPDVTAVDVIIGAKLMQKLNIVLKPALHEIFFT